MDDSPVRPLTKDPAQAAMPPLSVNFAYMIHNIHTGEGAERAEPQLHGDRQRRIGERFQRSPLSRDEPTGAIGDTTNCNMCHVERPRRCR